jgi:uncharacterized protein
MRRSEKEIKSRKDIESIITEADFCHIGLVDDNTPYVLPLNFGYKDNRLYFHSAMEGRKLNIIRQNNNVCFEIDADQAFVPDERACKWSLKYRSVIGNGKAFIVADAAEKIAALKTIMAHYSDKAYEFTAEEAARVVVVRIDIESITGKKSGY